MSLINRKVKLVFGKGTVAQRSTTVKVPDNFQTEKDVFSQAEELAAEVLKASDGKRLRLSGKSHEGIKCHAQGSAEMAAKDILAMMGTEEVSAKGTAQTVENTAETAENGQKVLPQEPKLSDEDANGTHRIMRFEHLFYSEGEGKVQQQWIALVLSKHNVSPESLMQNVWYTVSPAGCIPDEPKVNAEPQATA